MKATSLTTLAALVFIGVGGFMAGRISSPDSSTGQSASEKSKSARTSAQIKDETVTSHAGKSRRPERATAELAANRRSHLEEIIRSEHPLDRNRALLAFIDQLGPDDFEDAVAWFRSLGLTQDRPGEYALLLSAWAGTDPQAALAYAKENTANNFATHTILATWASIDPQAAIRWAQSNHEGDGANPYFAGIIRSLAASDPSSATQLLTGMPRSEERGEALSAMLPHLLAQGADATRTWIAGITDDSLRNGAIMRVANQLAASDPAGTAAWLLANPGEATQRSIDNVYGEWVKKNPQAAEASLASLPSGEIRSNALRGVVSGVALTDPQAAVALMDRYPNDVTDRVVQNLVWHSFGTNPSAAVNQIARIGDEHKRDQMYRRTLETWLEEDPAAANTWMQSNSLPSSVQKHLNRNQNPTQ